MTTKDELKKAIYTLKDYCLRNYDTVTKGNPCGTCMFEDCCTNGWSDYDTLQQVMGGLLEDIAIDTKLRNTDFDGARDVVGKLICNNFDGCKGCPFFCRDDDCPYGQLDSVEVHRYDNDY
jgi:hypothetical protein